MFLGRWHEPFFSLGGAEVYMRFSALARRENLAFFQCGLLRGAGAEGRALPGEEVVRHIRMGFNPSRHPVHAIAAYDDCSINALPWWEFVTEDLQTNRFNAQLDEAPNASALRDDRSWRREPVEQLFKLSRLSRQFNDDVVLVYIFERLEGNTCQAAHGFGVQAIVPMTAPVNHSHLRPPRRDRITAS